MVDTYKELGIKHLSVFYSMKEIIDSLRIGSNILDFDAPRLGLGYYFPEFENKDISKENIDKEVKRILDLSDDDLEKILDTSYLDDIWYKFDYDLDDGNCEYWYIDRDYDFDMEKDFSPTLNTLIIDLKKFLEVIK